MPDDASRYLLQEVANIVDSEGERPSIKATCTLCCVEREYLPSAFHVTSLETTAFQVGWQYEFFCGVCRCLSITRADVKTYAILVEAGVAHSVLLGPDEIAQIVSLLNAPISVTEVIEWERQLQRDDIIDELTAANEG